MLIACLSLVLWLLPLCSVSLLILPLLMLLISGCVVRALVVVLFWCVIALSCALDLVLC